MPTFTTELRQRRVLPLLGAYLGGMWLLTELAAFAVDRFGMTGRWAESLFLAMWLLLPSALLVIWRAGPPGDAVWRRRDAVVFTLNAVLAAAVLVLLPFGTPAPAAPTEPAPSAATAAPAADQPARVAIFTRPASAETRRDAMALLALTSADLDHDTRVDAHTLLRSSAIASRLRRSGRTDPITAPLGDLRLAAQDAGADAYVVARLVPAGESFQLEAEFHALSPDRSLPPLSVPAADPWVAADALAAEIRTRFAPASLADEANDPAVRAVTTDSAEALTAYAAGLEALSLDNDPARGVVLLQRAWELDPDFTLAGFASASTLSVLGRVQESQDSLQRILPRMSRLPERQRFIIQTWANPEPARLRVVYDAWLRKFPKDEQPRLALAWLDLHEDPTNAGALATISDMVLAGGDAAAFGQLAEVHRRLGDYPKAASLLREGLEMFPDDGTLIAALSDILPRLGEADAAVTMLEAWAQLRPDLVTPWLKLSTLHFNQQRLADSLAALDRAETQASTPGARLAVLQHRASLLAWQGRLRESLSLMPELEALRTAEVRATPLVYRHHVAHAMHHSQLHGRDATLAWVREAMPAGFDPGIAAHLLASVGLALASDQRDAGAMAAALAEFRAAMATFSSRVNPVETLRADRFEAELQWLSGHPDQALARFLALEQELLRARARGHLQEIDGQGFYLPAIAVATAAGDLAQARRWLAALEQTEAGDPLTQMARAELLLAAGDHAGAGASLDRALAVWADADPEHLPRQRALALASRVKRPG